MPESIIRIACNKCNELKPTDQFYGYSHECKTCTRERLNRWRASDAGKDSRRRERIKYQSTDRGREVNLRKVQRHAAKHPEQVKARNAINNRVNKGTLQRPSICSKCGAADRKIEAHHWSYAPEHRLDVVWVCSSCHDLLDKQRIGMVK